MANEEYLEHHGIKGQKWGIRRYQNEDGTYTAEGRARYGISSDGTMSREGKKIYDIDRKIATGVILGTVGTTAATVAWYKWGLKALITFAVDRAMH